MSVNLFDIEAIGPGWTELIRYRISSGERMLMASRAAAGIELWDCPASGNGLPYTVDCGFNDAEQLEDFVEDYEREAVRMDAPPMGDEAWLELLDLDGLEELVCKAFGES